MADPRWRTTILNFRFLLLSIAFSRCTSVSLLLVHKKGYQKRSLYQYYWYFTYLSGKIIRNIEKSEYDVTVTSSLGVASQKWVWGFSVWRWSLCVNFMTLALLVPKIKRGGGSEEPPPQSQIDQKSPVWIGLTPLAVKKKNWINSVTYKNTKICWEGTKIRLLAVCFSLEISAEIISPSSLLGHTAIPLFCVRDD